jgi:hypothetical protein
LRSAVADFDYHLSQAIDQHSHSIFIGDVVAAVSGRGMDTLLYGDRRFRTPRKVLLSSDNDGVDILHF